MSRSTGYQYSHFLFILHPQSQCTQFYLTLASALVSDTSTDDIWCFTPVGDSVEVLKPRKLAAILREAQICSDREGRSEAFRRQLRSVYGFKTICFRQRDRIVQWRFSHEHFVRDQPDILKCIVSRRIPNIKKKRRAKKHLSVSHPSPSPSEDSDSEWSPSDGASHLSSPTSPVNRHMRSDALSPMELQRLRLQLEVSSQLVRVGSLFLPSDDGMWVALVG
jgi:hypothetical protein